MELSWLMRLRIAGAVAAGVILIGLLAWPLGAPADPFGAVFAGTVSRAGAIGLGLLAVGAGFIGYFVSWPYGREIGILAVPSGLAVWAVRSGSMANLMTRNHLLAERQELFATLKWEPILWLAIVAAGFGGVLLGQRIKAKPLGEKPAQEPNSKSNKYLNVIIALVSSVVIVQFFIRIFAQDVRIPDSRVVSVLAQPAVGQIIFAVSASFAIAAFVAKKFLDVSYIWPTVAGPLVTAFSINTYVKRDVLQHLVQNWPATFFSNAVISILPVQMVAFGTFGSIAGYWLAIRYDYWRKHELK
jgi:hypothetical protein